MNITKLIAKVFLVSLVIALQVFCTVIAAWWIMPLAIAISGGIFWSVWQVT